MEQHGTQTRLQIPFEQCPMKEEPGLLENAMLHWPSCLTDHLLDLAPAFRIFTTVHHDAVRRSWRGLDSLAACLSEDLDEIENICPRVVQRGWRHSNDVWPSLIQYNACLLETLHHRIQKAMLEQDTQLRAALCRVAWGDDAKAAADRLLLLRSQQIEHVFQVLGQFETLLPQLRNGSLLVDIQARTYGRGVGDGRVADLETRGAGDGLEDIVHVEARGLR